MRQKWPGWPWAGLGEEIAHIIVIPLKTNFSASSSRNSLANAVYIDNTVRDLVVHQGQP